MSFWTGFWQRLLSGVLIALFTVMLMTLVG